MFFISFSKANQICLCFTRDNKRKEQSEIHLTFDRDQPNRSLKSGAAVSIRIGGWYSPSLILSTQQLFVNLMPDRLFLPSSQGCPFRQTSMEKQG
mmetsp:Transcript_5537/g.6101  ORF Transcript_5537/g.6101 Transcript_5537/m.6101 type:complete len:95 (-) Transcript_5537:1563-1847(-)